MTAIAAVADGATVWMAADSAACDGFGRVHLNPHKIIRLKVGRDDEALIGAAGRADFAELARHKLHLPVAPDPGDLTEMDAWAYGVATALTELAMEMTPPPRDTDGDLEGEALLGHAGRLWHLAQNIALPVVRGYDAIGSGSRYALGALYVQARRGTANNSRRVRVAVQSACEHSDGVRGPVVTETL